jgi:hypothetical protein
MKSAELELHAIECLVLAEQVSDPRQRQILREAGVSWLCVADQAKQSQRQPEPFGAAKRIPTTVPKRSQVPHFRGMV